ncbi:DUF805 domain-containing protein [Arthrobacter sp. UM1]|uniref:DUF805 domain-containing protein n=1 Tax=Arthrobacter sp. UM1 TaxID=2766776 RepID=UPI001CF7109F|nr:DUF805 domain-containing protein [Arthrobacter sp. UM1]MCB4208649.1 DUF805 domain-containing protein [Arthrobacter sp. UM1]
MATVGTDRTTGDANPFGVLLSGLLFIVMAGCLVPNLASGVRRLHDAGMSGWLWLLAVFPFFGSIALIILWALPSKPEGRFYDDQNAPGVREQFAGQSGFGGNGYQGYGQQSYGQGGYGSQSGQYGAPYGNGQNGSSF